MSKQKHLQTTDWVTQADLDCRHLKDRIKYSNQIRSDVKELLLEELVDSKLVKEQDFMFAGVKEYDRSSTKLLGYIEKKKAKLSKGKNADAVSSV